MFTCTIDEPYFSYIVNGKKKYEGRIRKGIWEDIDAGDTIYIKNGIDENYIEYFIESILVASDFEKLYNHLGTSLLPENPDTAWEIYSKWFTKEQEIIFGVVAIKLEKI